MAPQDFKRIDFEGLLNTRDLGGIKTENGQAIAPKKLLRSGALARATEQDTQRLMNDYNLQMVVDLRTEEERDGSPDPFNLLPDVHFKNIPLLQTSSLGITRGVSKTDLREDLMGLMEHPAELMVSIYPKILLDPKSQEGLKQFFDELLAAEEGSVLWHCSAGKDRVGLTTALLLTVLGVPQSTIVDDYLATNQYMGPLTQASFERLPEIMESDQMCEALRVMNSADIRFLQAALDAVNAAYGSLEHYLTTTLGVDKEMTETLRQKYLVS